MNEKNVTTDEQVGAEADLDNTETDTGIEESGGEETPEKVYTKAELDAILKDTAEKTRKSTERKLQRRYEREMAAKTSQIEETLEFNPDNVPKKDGETDAAWIARIARLQVQHEKLEADRQAKQVEAAKEFESFQESVDDFYERANAIPEFDEDEFRAYVTDYRLSDAWAEALVASDKGAQIAAWYVANPKEFERLSKLGKYQQVTDIGKIEARLEKQVKKAADPMTKVKGGEIPLNRLKNNPDSLTDAEYFALRKKEREKAYSK